MSKLMNGLLKLETKVENFKKEKAGTLFCMKEGIRYTLLFLAIGMVVGVVNFNSLTEIYVWSAAMFLGFSTMAAIVLIKDMLEVSNKIFTWFKNKKAKSSL